MCDKKTWKEIFDERLESIEQELNNTFSYDSREDVFTINMSELAQPTTFKEYYESCEIDEFEDYEEVSPEWDETADKLFKSYYLPKIKRNSERVGKHGYVSCKTFRQQNRQY